MSAGLRQLYHPAEGSEEALNPDEEAAGCNLSDLCETVPAVAAKKTPIQDREQARMATTKIYQTTLENIAPDVFRQRLLVEGYFNGPMTKDRVAGSLLELAAALDLRTYGAPVVFQPDSGMGKEENAGFDAFVPLIDSGISGYFWSGPGFFSLLIYTCKGFDNEAAISTVSKIYGVESRIVAHAF